MIAVYVGSRNKYLIFPWIASLSRPYLLVFMVTVLRNYWARYWHVIKGSIMMVIFILFYILYFAILGERLFVGTLQGANGFQNFFQSFWSMFVLLTTSNYPDIMLPSYKVTGYMCMFFIIFLFVGLFLLMNLLLAIFYSDYQTKTDETIDSNDADRNKYFHDFFTSNHKKREDGVKFIDRDGVLQLFLEVHSLVSRKDKTMK
jgi:hypothetical protein